MRIQKQLDLGEGRTVTIKEMTVNEIRNLLLEFSNSKDNLFQTNAIDLLGDKFYFFEERLKDWITIKEQNNTISIGALTTSECIQIWQTFREITPFLLPIIDQIKPLLKQYWTEALAETTLIK